MTIIGESGDWYQVEYRVVSTVLTGFIAKFLIQVPSNQEILNIGSAVTRTNVNVRSDAGTQYGVQIVLPLYINVKIISALGDWYLIEYPKDTVYTDQGYVAKFLITLPIAAAPIPTPTPAPSSFVYTVVAGVSLWKIAQKFGVTIDSIVKSNTLDINQPIYIGQQLTILK